MSSTSPDFRASVLKLKNLHPTAAVFARAHKLISSPRLSLEELANIIKLDSALTADVIRLSNSGALGGAVPNGNLLAAMGRIGMGEVGRYLGLSLSKRILNQNLRCYGLSSFDYWSSSVSAALLMELLAKRLQTDKNEAYTLGILHGVGRLVIDQVLTDLKITSCWDGEQPVEEWEMEVIGFTSAKAGAILLKEWTFPPSIFNIIEEQHLPSESTNPSPMLKMLNFSLQILAETGVAFTNREWTLFPANSFQREFHLSEESVKEIVKAAMQKHREAVISLGIVK